MATRITLAICHSPPICLASSCGLLCLALPLTVGALIRCTLGIRLVAVLFALLPAASALVLPAVTLQLVRLDELAVQDVRELGCRQHASPDRVTDRRLLDAEPLSRLLRRVIQLAATLQHRYLPLGWYLTN